jgi:hypothetical protein
LRELAAQCLTSDDQLFAGLSAHLRERELIVRTFNNGGAELTSSEMADLERRENRLTESVRGSDTVSALTAELFLLEKDATTTLLATAWLLDHSEQFLSKTDSMRSLANRRVQNREAAITLTGYIERWRGLFESDWDRIQAVECAAGFYQQLVRMLLDLGAPEEAWVASELARARATADLLAPTTENGLNRATLHGAVAELGQTVVEYFMAEHELVTWIIRPEGRVECVRIPVPACVLRELVQRLHDLAELPAPSPQQRQALRDTLRELGAHVWDPLPTENMPMAPVAAVTIIPHSASAGSLSCFPPPRATCGWVSRPA